ncbi:Uncharacterised protein [Anaerobiospirillum thomasii]|uniref:Uncharacterized protein n=1 Tax=Anaerobiospirillum thomasii TaxID=179995 RepID=A0A2X0VYY4_9GAMM|nr:Uncharacterised protein [Anaerobiospirillum thomasii]
MSAKMKECRDKGQLEINSRNYIMTLASAPHLMSTCVLHLRQQQSYREYLQCYYR